MASKIIKLNVGGRTFMTTLSTLSSKGENFLTRMIENHTSGKIPSLLDENGAFFIDRPGNLFEIILQYLQTGVLSSKTSPVMSELDYLGIHSLDSESNEIDENSLFEKAKSNCATQFQNSQHYKVCAKIFQLQKSVIEQGILYNSSIGNTFSHITIQIPPSGFSNKVFANYWSKFIIQELKWDPNLFRIDSDLSPTQITVYFFFAEDMKF